MVFTAISLVRGYALRRLFTRLAIKKGPAEAGPELRQIRGEQAANRAGQQAVNLNTLSAVRFRFARLDQLIDTADEPSPSCRSPNVINPPTLIV